MKAGENKELLGKTKQKRIWIGHTKKEFEFIVDQESIWFKEPMLPLCETSPPHLNPVCSGTAWIRPVSASAYWKNWLGKKLKSFIQKISSEARMPIFNKACEGRFESSPNSELKKPWSNQMTFTSRNKTYHTLRGIIVALFWLLYTRLIYGLSWNYDSQLMVISAFCRMPKNKVRNFVLMIHRNNYFEETGRRNINFTKLSTEKCNFDQRCIEMIISHNLQVQLINWIFFYEMFFDNKNLKEQSYPNIFWEL